MEEDRLRERFYGLSFYILNFEPYISFLFKRREKRWFGIDTPFNLYTSKNECLHLSIYDGQEKILGTLRAAELNIFY